MTVEQRTVALLSLPAQIADLALEARHLV